MPLQATSGAASQDAFGGNGVAVVPTYIEDVFSCFLYTGNSSTQTITNGIDLSTKGGLVWIKRRTSEAHYLFDTSRGVLVELNTDGQDGNQTKANSLTSFNTTGFSLGSFGGSNYSVAPDNSYVSWTFREQPKFFDVVTYTGTGSNRTVAHALGSVPASIWVKRTDTTSDWQVYHRSLANTEYLVLNSTAAKATGATRWNSTTPTSSVFSLGTDASVNESAGTYVAYIFAHNAGGFGLTGTDNVISCGSVVGASQVEVNLGYEPQWILVKNASAAQDWWVVDNMRGLPVQDTGGAYNASNLRPNLSDAETTGFSIAPSATGFKANVLTTGQTYIYIAIRRGPMKVPELGTSVYKAITYNGVGTAGQVLTGSGFPIDLAIAKCRSTDSGFNFTWMDRLRGGTAYLFSNTTGAEGNTAGYYIRSFDMDGVTYGTAYGDYTSSAGSPTYVLEGFRRAPGFFDEVCYTGTGANLTLNHNLGAVPELMIVKGRNAPNNWRVYDAFNGPTKRGTLNADTAWDVQDTQWNDTAPTATQFTVGTSNSGSGGTYVNYLFATCAGVSKVFSYTGNGSSQTINCGFTGGARFVLIKRTDSNGDWYVWDSARGIVAGNDPHLSLNSTAAEVTTDDSVDTDNTGFIVNQVAATNVNVTSATYIGIAIA